ncbi:sigma-70 family RNA polymerase sigma factor [Bizionia argentinensis JUB59]|uniref:Sigma-70 family RNA polymerase sigma factor n=1 Tax=Bizionia argentinensis JUB59 TaxID=1046627 RepID=G2ED99_9FLAO|nr:sigma-70 family RNA polymerase sigma factor [Bizionia argentinensis]EGV43630.1 sigma-70 family RNA polymerase sigma factor [Bizionia argentinensis JUB59]
MNVAALSDQELVRLVKQDQDYLGHIYKKHKEYCVLFMRKMTTGSKIREIDLADVYQDVMLILYEKIIKGDFVLTCALQTYLNSVCRFQILNKFKAAGKQLNFEAYEGFNVDSINEQYDVQIQDNLDDLGDQDEEQFTALERALQVLKDSGGKCFELLTLFWYHRKSMVELTDHFGYTNPANTKNQKAKCQKRLEKLAFNELNI